MNKNITLFILIVIVLFLNFLPRLLNEGFREGSSNVNKYIKYNNLYILSIDSNNIGINTTKQTQFDTSTKVNSKIPELKFLLNNDSYFIKLSGKYLTFNSDSLQSIDSDITQIKYTLTSTEPTKNNIFGNVGDSPIYYPIICKNGNDYVIYIIYPKAPNMFYYFFLRIVNDKLQITADISNATKFNLT